MISLFIFLLSYNVFSFPTELTASYELLETHEFYRDNELIQRPLDAWQTIASFSSVGSDLSLFKLCLKYRAAQEAKGIFKVEKIEMKESCKEEGDILYKIDSLFGIQFQRKPDFKIFFTHKDYSITEWNIKLQKKEGSLKLLDTPQKIWSEEILFLSDHESETPLLKDKEQCLEVLDDCSVKGVSRCQQCESGSIEAPNGCEIGPRYCSAAECGTKGNPACRRGVKFLKQRILDCRRDTSFAICQEGSTPVCQGQEVWCH